MLNYDKNAVERVHYQSSSLSPPCTELVKILFVLLGKMSESQYCHTVVLADPSSVPSVVRTRTSSDRL